MFCSSLNEKWKHKLPYRMSDSDVKRLYVFDRKPAGPVWDVVNTSTKISGRADFAPTSVPGSSAVVIHQPDAKQLISIESRPMKGKARLWIGLKVSGFRFRILQSDDSIR